MNIIVTKNLIKRYGKIIALKGVSLTVPRGITALMGENGAGKSTLIKVLTGKLRADGGEFQVLGMRDIKDIKKNVGIVHERISLPPEVSVEFFLTKVAEMYSIPRKKVKETIKLCGLERMKNKEIGQLSFGYTKRVGIAQAIIHEPELIIADEPFTQLDAKSKINIRDLFHRLYIDQGISFFISSHNLYDLEQISNHFIIIHQGKIVKEWKGRIVENILVRSDNNRKLMEYLQQQGYETKCEDMYVIIHARNIKEVMRNLLNFKGEIYEVRTTSLEQIFKEVSGDDQEDI